VKKIFYSIFAVVLLVILMASNPSESDFRSYSIAHEPTLKQFDITTSQRSYFIFSICDAVYRKQIFKTTEIGLKIPYLGVGKMIFLIKKNVITQGNIQFNHE